MCLSEIRPPGCSSTYWAIRQGAGGMPACRTFCNTLSVAGIFDGAIVSGRVHIDVDHRLSPAFLYILAHIRAGHRAEVAVGRNHHPEPVTNADPFELGRVAQVARRRAV